MNSLDNRDSFHELTKNGLFFMDLSVCRGALNNDIIISSTIESPFRKIKGDNMQAIV